MGAPIDLRSDTVTQPTAAMRLAMADAEVGDDVYREDPTVRRLEERAAELTGKPAALFVPSGTMSNQIALLCHARPGDEVIVGRGAHVAYYESGAGAALAGVQFVEVGEGGLFDEDAMSRAVKPAAYYHPRTRLVALENTHNRAGGRVFPQPAVVGVAAQARRHGLSVHLDGARIWNASVASGLEVAELCAPADTVSVCFSKGLGAPVGSALCGTAEVVLAALRFRKMLGGGMRQAGVLAAAALYALDHHRERLRDDHTHARRLHELLGDVSGVAPHAPETNIVNIDTVAPAARLSELAARRGVLVSPSGEHRLRAVTHLDVGRDDIERAAEILRAVAEEARQA
jgi:threonine aldolase